MKNNDKNDIIKSSLSSPIKEFLMDIANIGLDEIMDKTFKELKLLKEIPIIKWLFLGNDVRTIIQSAFFLQKYSNFIGLINESMKDDLLNENKLNEIFLDRKVYSKIIEQTIISLDRYQAVQKAKLLSLLLVETFRNNNFSVKEHNTLIFSIENIHPAIGIVFLKSFYEYKYEMYKEENKEMKEMIWSKNSTLDYSPLATTCLLRLPIGAMASVILVEQQLMN